MVTLEMFGAGIQCSLFYYGFVLSWSILLLIDDKLASCKFGLCSMIYV